MERQIKLFLSLLGLSAKEIRLLEQDLDYYFENRDLFFIRAQKHLSSYRYTCIKKANYDQVLKRFDDLAEKLEIQVLVRGDEDYPWPLEAIENPPEVLYYRGDLLRCMDQSLCGVVGARNHTSYGKVLAQSLGKDLANRGVTLVSGMALGIDALSQRACLENRGLSIGVLGTGIDVVYPSKNQDLYQDLVQWGAVLSEYPPGTQGKPFRFPERNRIIAGLSQAVVVVEAKEKSGSLITARLAAEAGKDVFAIPGNINSPYSQGCNALIRDGALIYTSSQDLDFLFPEKIDSPAPMDLSKEEVQILREIAKGATTGNLLCDRLKQPIGKITGILTIMEMKSLIVSQGTDQFALSPSLRIEDFLS